MMGVCKNDIKDGKQPMVKEKWGYIKDNVMNTYRSAAYIVDSSCDRARFPKSNA